MAWFFNFVSLETTWLDEVAEGLRNVIGISHTFRNWVDGLPVELLWKTKSMQTHTIIVEAMRQCCYSLGVVAHQLILSKESEEEDKKKEEQKNEKVDLSKLVMLQGGLERRFIPELSDKTKLLIEGFFKITMDDQLRDLSLKKPEQVELSEDDKLLARIIEPSKDASDLALDSTDYVELTILCLQQMAVKKKGPIMVVGGVDGLRLTRSAFTVILKFSELVDMFRAVWDEVEMVGMGIDGDKKS